MEQIQTKSKSNLVYLYNIGQINFYLQRGLRPLQIGIGIKGDTFTVFDYEEHNKVFDDWLNAQYSYQMVNLHLECTKS